MRRQNKRSQNLMSEINVVPYIDVMLVLLVIFMITAPLLTQGVKINLPQSQAETLPPQPTKPIIVSVDQYGRLFLNISNNPDEPLAPENVATRVAAEVALAERENKTQEVLIKGDQGANYGQVVTAMVMLQHAGVKQLGLMTKPSTEPTTETGKA